MYSRRSSDSSGIFHPTVGFWSSLKATAARRRLPLPTVTEWCGNVGCHNCMFVVTRQAHGISPTKPQTQFCILHPPVRGRSDLRASVTGFHVGKRAEPGHSTHEKGESAVLYISSDLLCQFVKGRGCRGGKQGEGSWLSRSLPGLLSLFSFRLR